jgi:flagellar assembly protein FliH
MAIALPDARPPRFLAEAEARPGVVPAAFSREALSRSLPPARPVVNAFFAAVPRAGKPRPAPIPALRPAVPAPAAAFPPEASPKEPEAPAPELEPAAPPALLASPPEEPRLSRRDELDPLTTAVEALRLTSARLAEQARSDVLELAFVIAKRILESELEASPRPLFALVRSAIRRLGEARQIRVRLSPLDAAVVEEALAQGELPDLSVAEAKVVADAGLARGDCIVESEMGCVDGRLDVRLGELRRAIGPAAEGGAA